MTVEEIAIYTVADLERERGLDERLRWDLLEGELVMTPAPRPIHQQLALRRAVRLLASVDPPSTRRRDLVTKLEIRGVDLLPTRR